jgi:predicted 3-demethylubiquinone-9 3-methyltransferase (glyoxalase superfamily)
MRKTWRRARVGAATLLASGQFGNKADTETGSFAAAVVDDGVSNVILRTVGRRQSALTEEFARWRDALQEGHFEPRRDLMASKPSAKIFPFLWYAKEAEEAAAFYASIFPDSRVDRVTTMMSDSPSGPPGSVKVVDFTLFGQRFQAMTAGPHHDFNDAISMMVECDDQAELDRYWNALLAGGGKPQACGWLVDKFGLRWQIVPAVLEKMMADPDPARAKRASDAMMKMVKLDIATLEQAYRA